MRKRLIIVLMVLIMTLCLCSCTEYGKVSLSQEKRSEIVSAYAQLNGSKEEFCFGCYGIFDETYVLLRESGMFLQATSEETVDGVTYYFGEIKSFIVYRDGEFCSLQEAFDKGLINHKNLITIKRNYEAQEKKDAKS